jgi:mRNA-degrading endonuclease YafQ of YafQ-DinJ toxin-antitoxin module
MMVKITYSKTFLKRYKKLKKGNKELDRRIEIFIEKFVENPFYSGLETHKIFLDSGYVYSSRVTGDIRILWRFINDEEVFFQSIGGHEGKHSVYR